MQSSEPGHPQSLHRPSPANSTSAMAAATAAMLARPQTCQLRSVRGASSRFAPLLPAVSRRCMRSPAVAQAKRADDDLQVRTAQSLAQPLPTLHSMHISAYYEPSRCRCEASIDADCLALSSPLVSADLRRERRARRARSSDQRLSTCTVVCGAPGR